MPAGRVSANVYLAGATGSALPTHRLRWGRARACWWLSAIARASSFPSRSVSSVAVPNGPSGCSYLLAIVKNAVINMGMQIAFRDLLSVLWGIYISRSGTAGSCVNQEPHTAFLVAVPLHMSQQ